MITTVQQYPSACEEDLYVCSRQISGEHLILIYVHMVDQAESVGLVVVHIPTRKEVYGCNDIDTVDTRVEERSLKVPRVKAYTKNRELVMSLFNGADIIITTRRIRTN